MSQLAIVIPYVGNSKRLEDTLVSVLANRPDGSEVVVVLDAPYDDPYDLDDEICFVEAPKGTSPAASVNYGIEAAHAPLIHVLTCGCEVSEGWTEAAVACFEDARVAAVAPLVIQADDRDRVLAAGLGYSPGGQTFHREQGRRAVLIRDLADVTAPHPAAAFYRRSALESAGGFPGQWSLPLATLDLALTFDSLGLDVVLEPQSAVAAPPLCDPVPGAFRRSLEAERFYWRWSGQSKRTSLVAHVGHVTADCLAGFANLSVFARTAGRLVGLLGRNGRRNAARLAELRDGQRAPAAAPRSHLRNGPTAIQAIPTSSPTPLIRRAR